MSKVSKNKILTIIPAREGSKRIPGKNVRLMAGKPLISWTIAAALEANISEYVVVSTDCEKIRELALSQGAQVPFMRPKALAGDNSSTTEAVMHAIEWYSMQGIEFTHVLILQPTSPLRIAADICAALTRLEQTVGEAVISVCACKHPPQWTNLLPKNGSMQGFISKENLKPSQSLQPYYRLNGAIYLCSLKFFHSNNGIAYSEGVYALQMPESRSVDIDEEEEFLLAEIMLQRRDAHLV